MGTLRRSAMEKLGLESRIRTACMLVLSAIALGFALHWLQPVLIPLVLAVFVSYAVSPLVDVLVRRLRVPYAIGMILAFLVGGALLTAAGLLISYSVRELAENADLYNQEIKRALKNAAGSLPLEKMGVGPEMIEDPLRIVQIQPVLTKLANSVVDVLSNAFLVLVFVIYLLIGGRRPKPETDDGTGLRSKIRTRIQRYVSAKLVFSAATGAIVGLILAILGVKLPLVFGALTFLLNFIPTVGSIVATLLPLPMVLVTPEWSWTTAILVLVLPGTVQVLIGNVLEPKVLGDSLELHPITVLSALVLWGMIWGIVGMFLAVPLTAVLKILLESLEMTRPVARLLAGHIEPPSASAP